LIKVYNTFILPTLLFIAQLEHPPQHTIQADMRMASRIAPGRGRWCKTSTLSHLRDIGAPTEVRDLQRNAAAAMARVAQWEGSLDGGIKWSHMTYDLYHAGKNETHDNRIFDHRYWHDRHFATTVYNHKQQLRSQHNITTSTVRKAITHDSPLPLTYKDPQKWKKTTQKNIHQTLRANSTHHIEEQIRKRLTLWSLPNFQRRMVSRCMKNLRAIFDKTSPRICFTCWSTIFRRWTTAQAFQTKGSRCLMGCDNFDDSLDHYSHCNIIRRCAQRKLGLRTNPLESKTIWTLSIQLPDNDLCKVAYMIYASYRTTNFMRQAGKGLDQPRRESLATQYWNQIIHEADRGSHKFSLKSGDSHQRAKRPSQDMVQAPPNKKRVIQQDNNIAPHQTYVTGNQTTNGAPTTQNQSPLIPQVRWSHTHHGIWTRHTSNVHTVAEDNWPRRRRLNNHTTLPVLGTG